MGLLQYTVAGGALLLIGAYESLISTAQSLSSQQPSSLPQTTNQTPNRTTSLSLTIKSFSIAVLSLTFILNSFISLLDASRSKDKTGFSLQLQIITIALLFLLCSLLGILSNTLGTFKFPLKFLNLMYVFAFGEEFLLFYMQRKDPIGVENRYYDLLLVPVAMCLFSTIFELKDAKSVYPRLGRGVGLVLQGMWTLQMGFSFYSNMIANGCDLHEKSRGNFTIKCKGHPEYHRGRAIAVLQFNCHLALLVTLVAVVYSVLCRKYRINRESLSYKPLGEMQFDSHSQFSLDTDDEDDERDVIKEVGNVEMQKAIVVVPDSVVNGNGSHA